MLNKQVVGTFAACSLLAAAGCTLFTPDEDTASISLDFKGSSASADLVTLPPSNGVVAQAVVTIEQIILQPADSEGDPLVLREGPVVTDLLSLAEDTARLVDDTPIPAGRYSELRFVISGAYLNVVGQGIFATPGYDQVPADQPIVGELKTPSFNTSGLKVKLPSDDLFSKPGLHKIVLVRFDVAESFGHEAGNSGSWVMHPVIEAESVETLAEITLDINVGDLRDALAAKPWICVLIDAQGFVEMTAELSADSAEDQWVAHFPYVFPSDAPYRLVLQTVDGLPVVTEPALPQDLTITASAHAEIEVTATAIGP